MTDLIEYVIGGKIYVATPQQFVDEIQYKSYLYNRRRNPDITAEQWGLLFINWRVYEDRLQMEIQNG